MKIAVNTRLLLKNKLDGIALVIRLRNRLQRGMVGGNDFPPVPVEGLLVDTEDTHVTTQPEPRGTKLVAIAPAGVLVAFFMITIIFLTEQHALFQVPAKTSDQLCSFAPLGRIGKYWCPASYTNKGQLHNSFSIQSNHLLLFVRHQVQPARSGPPPLVEFAIPGTLFIFLPFDN